MKWLNHTAAFIAATIMASATIAQEATPPPAPPKPGKEKSEEIIIRKKDGKSEKMTIVVDGDKVTINGKPMDDYKDGNVKIITRKRSSGGDERPQVRAFAFPHGGAGMNWSSDDDDFDMENFMPSGVNKAMLGVMTSKTDDGVKVTDVTKDGGAEKAGLKKDDIITKVGSDKVSSPKELTEAIGKYKPNDKVDITYKRNGKEGKATATLTENKNKRIVINRTMNGDDFDFDMPDVPTPPGSDNFSFNFVRKPKVGLQIQDLEEGKGVKVKDVDDDSPASKAGLKEGDVITQANGKEVVGVDDLRSVIKDAKEGDTIKLSYTREGKTQSTDVKIPKRLKSADL